MLVKISLDINNYHKSTLVNLLLNIKQWGTDIAKSGVFNLMYFPPLPLS